MNDKPETKKGDKEVEKAPLSKETVSLLKTELSKAARQFSSKGIVMDVPEGKAYLTVSKGKGFAEVVTKSGTHEAARID